MTPALPGEAPDPSATPRLDALLKEVEALDREATPGPWMFDNGSIRGVVEEGPHADHVVPGFAFAKRTRIVASMHGPGNDGAVTKYRTAAPRLAAMLRVAVEALGFYESGSRNAFRCNNERLDPAKGTGPCCERVIDAGGIAQDALARIEAMAKGEA